jgi:hypothetical protein
MLITPDGLRLLTIRAPLGSRQRIRQSTTCARENYRGHVIAQPQLVPLSGRNMTPLGTVLRKKTMDEETVAEPNDEARRRGSGHLFR